MHQWYFYFYRQEITSHQQQTNRQRPPTHPPVDHTDSDSSSVAAVKAHYRQSYSLSGKKSIQTNVTTDTFVRCSVGSDWLVWEQMQGQYWKNLLISMIVYMKATQFHFHYYLKKYFQWPDICLSYPSNRQHWLLCSTSTAALFPSLEVWYCKDYAILFNM